MKVMRKVVNIVLSFMLVILLFAGVTVGFTYATFFDAEHMEISIAKTGFFESYRDSIKHELETQLRNSGTGDGFIESLVPDNVYLLFRNDFYKLYGDRSFEQDFYDYMAEYENDLAAKVRAEAMRQGANESEIDDETVNEFVKTLVNSSVLSVSAIPFSSDFAPYVTAARDMIKIALTYCTIVGAILFVLLIIMNVVRKRDSIFKYLTIIFSGVLFMSGASFLYLYFAKPISARFTSYNLFAKVIGGYSNVFLQCLLAVTAIFFVMTIVSAVIRYVTYRRCL